MAGCSGGVFLPIDGPRRDVVFSGAAVQVQDLGASGKVNYALIGLSPNVLTSLQAQDVQPVFQKLRSGGRPATVRIGIGDVVSLTIFESAAGGLFVPSEGNNRAGNYVQLPPQQVDGAGNMSVPYGGIIHAAGQTMIELQNTIQSRLANRALEPQVIASLVEQHANIVSVFGDVTQSTRFALDPSGDRVLGAVARAGGPKYPSYETFVTVQRGGMTDRALLSAIGEDPRQNVELQPGDSLYVSREPRYFLTLGATGIAQSIGLLNKRIPFEDTRLSLADAVAKVGGLQDDRANPAAVFVYRFEPRSTIKSIMGDQMPPDMPEQVPTVYTVDFSRPDAFFLASKMPVHSEDVVFVSNAPATDLTKFLTLLLPLGYSAANFRSGFQ